MSSITLRATRVSARLRAARVGDLLTDAELGGRTVRRQEATALVLPGRRPLAAYLAVLDDAALDLAAWDGRVVALPSDGEPRHRLLLVDRYGQVYAVFDGTKALPDVPELEEWFRFLATACPECGVLDDPIGRGWVP